MDEKLYQNSLIYVVACKPLYVPKPLRIVFRKVDEYIRNYDWTKYLVLFHSDEKYKRIFARIRCLIMLKSNIPDVYSHWYVTV